MALHPNFARVFTRRFNHPNFSGRHLFDLFGVPTQCYNKTCHMVCPSGLQPLVFGEAATLLTRRPPCLLARTQVDLPFVFHFTSYPTLNYQCVCCHSGRVAQLVALRSFLPLTTLLCGAVPVCCVAG